jgi:formylglycine-generating enzyme required for sulfatase activity
MACQPPANASSTCSSGSCGFACNPGYHLSGGVCVADSSTMIAIPAGSFMMGCNVAADADCSADEYPYHLVTLSAYQIDRYEVTQADYQVCVAAGSCMVPQANFDPTGTPTVPVRDVPWTQAAAYCSFVGKRLPTEAEWERAARGTDGRRYPWGAATPTCTLAIYLGCSAVPLPVGSRPAGASAVGELDVGGNVFEWVSDFYSSSYYAVSPANNPTGPASGTSKVVRGGSYANSAAFLRVSNRVAADPALPYDGIGLRCAQ